MLALVASGWYFTPYATVKELTEAARRNDALVLSEHIDWESVRLNASSGIKTCAADLARVPTSGAGGASVRGLLGGVVDSLLNGVFNEVVNRVVTPEFVATLIAAPNQVASNSPMPDNAHKVVWKAIDRVELWVNNGAQGASIPRVELRRKNISWRVSRVMFDCPNLP